MFRWCFSPCVLGHQCGTYLLEFLIVKDSFGAALDVDSVTGLNECLGGGGGECGAVFEGFANCILIVNWCTLIYMPLMGTYALSEGVELFRT